MPGPDDLAFELKALSARLREAGDGGLTRELSNGIGRAVDPLKDQIRTGLKPRLPDRYAAVLDAELAVTRRTFITPAEARVTVYATTRGTEKRRLRRLDQGILAHPLYGNRRHWYDQEVRPGWFTGAVEDAVPQVLDGIQQALDEVKRKIEGG